MHIFKQFVKPIKLMNSIFYLICIIGFCYQVYLIFDVYMLGKTVVNIELKRLTSQPLPAITVCIPFFYSVQKLAKLNQGYYQYYMKVWNEGRNNKNFTDEMKKKLVGIYAVLQGDTTQKKINNYQKIMELGTTYKSITIMFKGDDQSINKSFLYKWGKNGNDPIQYDVKETPIMSLVFDKRFPGFKCFTYFSSLKQY